MTNIKRNIGILLISQFIIMSAISISNASDNTIPFPELIVNTQEAKYLLEVKNVGPIVNVKKDEIEDAWGRAQSYISKFSSMKIQTANNWVVETYNPPDWDYNNAYEKPQYGYKVTKEKELSGDYSIICDCMPKIRMNFWTQKPEQEYVDVAKMNQQILAYYIKYGILISKFINKNVGMEEITRKLSESQINTVEAK